jgi:hypothetical protein
VSYNRDLKRTQVGRIAYEILRVMNEAARANLDEQGAEHALGLLIADGGSSRHRAEILGQMFYGCNPDEARQGAQAYVRSQELHPNASIGLQLKIKVTDL